MVLYDEGRWGTDVLGRETCMGDTRRLLLVVVVVGGRNFMDRN